MTAGPASTTTRGLQGAGCPDRPDDQRSGAHDSGAECKALKEIVLADGTGQLRARLDLPPTSRRRADRPALLLGREPEPRLQHQAHLAGGRAPERAPGHVVRGLDLLPVLGHRRVLLVGRRRIERPSADSDDLGGGAVGPFDPAPDLVPVLVEEHDDRDGAVAVVQEAVRQVEVLIAEEHAQLAVRHRLTDVREQRRVAVDISAPVLGEHQGVLDLADAAEELPLLLGQDRLGIVVLGAGPGVAHLGHVVLPRHARGEALRVQGNPQLAHVALLWLGWRRRHYLYTKTCDVATSRRSAPLRARRTGLGSSAGSPLWRYTACAASASISSARMVSAVGTPVVGSQPCST